MRCQQILWAIASIFLTLALTVPAPVVSRSESSKSLSLTPRDGEKAVSVREVEERQNPVLTVLSLIDLVGDVVDYITDLFEDQAEKQGAFTQRTVSTIREQFPDKNVIVYHDQDSYYELYNAVHTHYELPGLLGTTKGYEIWVFDWGYFQLAGDGGYQNWAIGGLFDDEDGDGVITFYQIT